MPCLDLLLVAGEAEEVVLLAALFARPPVCRAVVLRIQIALVLQSHQYCSQAAVWSQHVVCAEGTSVAKRICAHCHYIVEWQGHPDHEPQEGYTLYSSQSMQ